MGGYISLPVIALPVQQRLGIAVQGVGLCGVVALRLVVQRQEEGGGLHGLQRGLVHPLAEVLETRPRPRHSGAKHNKDTY